jgi:hypothetical protein
MFRLRPIPLLLSAALLVLGADAWAQGRGRGEPPPRGPERPQREAREMRDSLSDSIRRAERDTRGQVLGAERVPFDGREVHRVKVIDDRGRVRVYMDDPRADEPRDRRGEDRRPRRPTRGDDD